MPKFVKATFHAESFYIAQTKGCQHKDLHLTRHSADKALDGSQKRKTRKVLNKLRDFVRITHRVVYRAEYNHDMHIWRPGSNSEQKIKIYAYIHWIHMHIRICMRKPSIYWTHKSWWDTNDPTRCKHTSSHIQAVITSTTLKYQSQIRTKPRAASHPRPKIATCPFECPTTSNTRDVQPYVKPDNKQAKTNYSAEESEYSDTI